MSLYLIILIISLLSSAIKQSTANFGYRKFVYQKDVSEFCRRRVVPAVFLGKQVVDANSQILHFSRLEVPYSCFITVRTEMGSNIIIVIQVTTDINLKASCRRGDHQLLIHKIGETFGGYWGQMPDSVMQRGKGRPDRTYTLSPRPTIPPTTTTKRTYPTTVSTTQDTKLKQNEAENAGKDKSDKDRKNYISIEVPILNISANIVPGKIEVGPSFTKEDTFNLDVIPRSGISYETEVVPLVELGMQNSRGDSVSQLEVELNNIFTPDPRLMFSDYVEMTHKKKVYKYHPYVNKHQDFKKHKSFFIAKQPLYRKRLLNTNRRPQLNTVQQNNYVSKLYKVKEPSTYASEESAKNRNYWDTIHDILKNLSKTSDVTTQPPHKELANFLQGISNQKYNKSVYLNPKLSYIDLNTPLDPITEHRIITTTEQLSKYRTTNFIGLKDLTKSTNVLQDFRKSDVGMDKVSIINNNHQSVTMPLLPIALDVDSIILNVTNKHVTGLKDNPSKVVVKINDAKTVEKVDPLPVSLVDHESFENIVQSASAMAVKLNHTKVTDDNKGVHDEPKVRKRRQRGKKRKKRILHNIDIQGAEPHTLHVIKRVTTTPPPERFIKKDFQRLVELQDDEIHGRMSMMYLPDYMGPPLLDFCDFNETSTKYVYLFNSSRLVLAISNFTLKRMTVVMTPAQTLRFSEARCGAAQLECQVSGARVCIDSLCACDGVPNCGSYDVYDEDRLTCGAAAGFRHNVWLAAVTFLAVLFTILYTIHYWLKRCIPKVSDAFFIYTDAAENVLYLDSIMKSPHDMGVYRDFYSGLPELFEYEGKDVKLNRCRKFIKRCSNFLRLRRKTPQDEDDMRTYFSQPSNERLSTFAQLEINKLNTSGLIDTAVQTGSSLQEVLDFSSFNSQYDEFTLEHLVMSPMERTGSEQLHSNASQPLEELNMLQFLRKIRGRSISQQQSSIDSGSLGLNIKPQLSTVRRPSKEKEIRSEIYDREDYHADGEVTAIQPQTSKQMISTKTDKPDLKHLRFQDDTLIIASKDEELDEIVERIPNNPRRSIVFGANKVFQIQAAEEKRNETEEQNAGKETKSYFNWGKEKKKKKPKKK